MTIDELKAQRHWVFWKLEQVRGKDTRGDYQPDGRGAMSNKPDTWHTFTALNGWTLLREDSIGTLRKGHVNANLRYVLEEKPTNGVQDDRMKWEEAAQ